MDKMQNINEYILKNFKEGNLSEEITFNLLQSINQSTEYGDDIAIIGMACNLPEAKDINEYWNNLKKSVISTGKFPITRRRDIDGFICEDENKTDNTYNLGGYLDSIDKFDSEFFKILHSEAELIDPGQRLFLQNVYEAIENAGYSSNTLNNTDTGIYVGIDHTNRSIYGQLIEEDNLLSVTGSWTGMLASRVSNFLNLSGPSMVIDTACSSGLVSIHTACKALKNKECSMAIAGGINLILFPVKQEKGLNTLETDSNIIRVFDKGASGTLWSEGVATVILKPLRKAISDQDNIYAVIKGSAINNNGHTSVLTAPSVKGQEKVILSAWKDAKIDPETITYIETQGTGTTLGDSIEIKAIENAFREHTNKIQFCGIGSVKPNIGHSVAVSGIVSFIKVALSLSNRVLVPTLNFEKPNEHIKFYDSPIYLNDRLCEWSSNSDIRRVGVNSFGFSGTNCHVVLEEAPQNYKEVYINNENNILALSGRDQNGLKSIIKKYYNYLFDVNGIDLNSVCYTNNVRRIHYDFRIAILFKNENDLKIKLKKLICTEFEIVKDKEIYYGKCDKLAISNDKNEKVFVYENTKDNLEYLAQMYVRGLDVDWKKIYEGKNLINVSLPVHEFKKKRCWAKLKTSDLFTSKDLSNDVDENIKSYEKYVDVIDKNDKTYCEDVQKLANILGIVFDISEISLDDNLYELGLNSLNAMRLSNYISKEFKVNVTIETIYNNLTVRNIFKIINGLDKNEDLVIEVAKELEYYPLTLAQKGIFMLNHQEKNDSSLNMTNMWIIEGQMNIELFKNVFIKLIERHEIFRTSFHLIDGEVKQKIHNNVEFELDYVEEVKDEEELNILAKSFIKPFDLSKAPLFRCGLIKICENKHLFIFDIHHIISDGTSIYLLMHEISKLYEDKPLPKLRIQCKDYAVWLQEKMDTSFMKSKKIYWEEKFKHPIELLNLPTDYIRKENQKYIGEAIDFTIDTERVSKLNKIASKHNATLHTVIFSIYAILLNKYCGQEDVIIGSFSSGRRNVDLQNVQGMLSNILPIRCDVKSDCLYSKFLESIKIELTNAYENQEYDFHKIIRKQLINNSNTNSLFTTLLNFHNEFDKDSGFKIKDLKFSFFNFSKNDAQRDIQLDFIQQLDGALYCNFEYDARIFKKSTAERMVKHFMNIIDNILEESQKRIADIDMLTYEERNEIIFNFNQTKKVFDKNNMLIEMFEKQVKNTPDNIAVTFEDENLTYKQLNEKSNQVARMLRDNGVVPDTVIGIMVERSLEMIVGIIGILKAGGAYLPIDPSYPKERINYLLSNSSTNKLITSKEIKNNLDLPGIEIISVEEVLIDNKYSVENLELNYPQDRLMYVLYTSGSTGNPKGVMVKYDSFSNLITWFIDEFNISNSDNILLIAPVSFDLAQKNLYATLIKGGRLCLFKPGIYDYNTMSEVIEKEDITIINCTPSAFQPLIDFNIDTDFNRLKSLRHIYLGGEPINLKIMEPWIKSKNYNGEIVNTYGPTECTDIASFYRVDNNKVLETASVPIGKPISNTRLYVLDKNQNILPIGVPGELYIGGLGVSKGYYNHPELTDNKFVICSGIDEPILYRTGDLVKWLLNGELEFLGRIDYQVKIRGFRVELEEVEAKIIKLSGVKECAVVAIQDTINTKSLCAYVIIDKDYTITKLKEELNESLPEFMIPTYFIELDKMPLTPNGKIDRKTLLNFDKSMKIKTAYEAPKNIIEDKLISIWESVLSENKIGVNDNFFDLGGNSLKVIIVIAKIHKELNVDIPVAQYFKIPTIRELGEYIQNSVKDKFVSIQPAEPRNYYSSSMVQKRIYSLKKLDEYGTNYNMPFALRLNARIDVIEVERIFKILANRHESLRTSFELIDGQVMQKVASNIEFKVFYKDADEHSVRDIFKHFVKPFDLAKAPLFRVGLIKLGNNDHVLLIDMHHIISDGQSIDILKAEFLELMKGNTLLELKIQYKDYAVWQEEFNNSDSFRKQEEYWLNAFSGDIPLINLPIDYPRTDLQSFDGGRVTFSTDKILAEEIYRLAKETGTTTYMVILAAYNILLANYTYQNDIIIGMPIAGRNHYELENVIGMFVNTLPIRSFPSGDKEFIVFLNEIKETLINSYENQDYDIGMLISKLGIKRTQSRNVLVETVFTLRSDMTDHNLKEEINFEILEYENTTSKFDISLSAVETKECLYFELEYCTKLFALETVERMSEHLIKILSSIAENRYLKLNEIQIEDMDFKDITLEDIEFNF